MGKAKNNKKRLETFKKRRRSSKKLIVKKNISKTVAMDIDEPNVSVDDVIEDDNDNSLPTDEVKSLKKGSSKVTVPYITNDEIIDITNITAESITLENSQTVDHKKTALNIGNDEVIDITDITIINNTHEDVPKQFSNDTILLEDDDDDDVQIIDIPTHNKNNSIELITISDDSDEESTLNQPSIEKPNSLNSVHERLGIATTGTIKSSSYNSPLRNRKRKWEEENITKFNNLGGFVIDKQKISSNSQNCITLETKPVKVFKPHVSSTVTTSKTNRKLRPIIIDGLNIGFA